MKTKRIYASAKSQLDYYKGDDMNKSAVGKFTPGPWKLISFGTRDGVANNEGSPIAEVVERKDGTAYANASLIASAPELLEALKAINNLANAEGEQVGFSLKAQRLAQEAIAKAGGRV